MNTAKDIIAKSGKLRSNWSTRDRKIKEWYNILTLKDELKQEGMESVTSNDPRTGYNLAKHLMTSSIIAHKISAEELTSEQIAPTSYLESYMTKRWADEEKRYRGMGRKSQLGEIVALMLATGWYSIFSMVDERRAWNEIWNPIEVYPEFGYEGLVEGVHIYSMVPAVANLKARRMGWPIKRPFSHNVALYDYWGFDNMGDTVNGIVLGTELVKPLEIDIPLTKLHRLPLLISPVGGLPDMGAITNSKAYQEHFGEALVATNEDLAKNYNRMLTFQQQLMRDTANPRWFEQSQGETPILREEDLFKRGAIFRGAPGENVGPLPVPPIPVELRTMMFDYQNMLQRGLFPWAIFGNIQQQMSYLAMANIASAALQVLTPYMEAMVGLLGDIDNYWFQMIKENGFRPSGFEMPKDLPKEFEFEVQANIEIPGYLIQRATVARMLDPSFRLSTTTVMDRLFPEVRDSIREMARARKDDAMMHPKAIIADQVLAYREQARLFRKADQEDAAILYDKLAKALEAEISLPQQPTGGTTAPTSPPREVLPGEFSEPIEGLGRV